MGNVFEFDFSNNGTSGFIGGVFMLITMKLKSFGYTDEEVFAIAEEMFDLDIRLDPERVTQIDKIMDGAYKLSGTGTAEDFYKIMQQITGRIDGKY